MTTSILTGHVLDVLATLPERHYHALVTSPPFYSLRAYQTEPQVWGGDALCDHDFDTATVTGEVGRGNWAQGVNGRGEEQPGGVAAKREPIRTQRETGLCPKCGAWKGELGGESTPDCLAWARGDAPDACRVGCFLCHLRLVMAAVRRVLRDDGVAFVELGDGYATTSGGGQQVPQTNTGAGLACNRVGAGKLPGIKPKSLILVPERFRLAMVADGWVCRSVIRWARRAPMPESVRDRPTSAVSEVVMLTKQGAYYSDLEAVKEVGEGYGRSNWNAMQFKGGDITRNHGGKGNHGKGGGTPTYEGGRNPRNYAVLDPADWEGRPAGAVREVVMLTKDGRYFCDMQAVAEQMAPESAGRYAYAFGGPKAEHLSVTDNHTVPIGKRMPTAGRNPRNYAEFEPPADDEEDVEIVVRMTRRDAVALGIADDPDWAPPPGWFKDYTLLSPEPSKRAHYASYGPKAITPLVKMATSEYGACAKCGAAWERIIERATAFGSGSGKAGNVPNGKWAGTEQAISGDYDIRMGPQVSTTTTGWRPRCSCNADVVPCRCLDIFAGSGTTLVVAERLGLDATGIELNESYSEMARQRIAVEGAPLFAGNGHDEATADVPSQLAMMEVP